MTRLAVAIFLLAALPAYAQQQMYRCVDQNNRLSFSDKPGPGCTATKPSAEKKSEAKTGQQSAKKSAKSKNVAKAKPPESQAQRCKRLGSGFSDMRPEERAAREQQLAREC